eukprot:1506417-Alexandrium_andersonii.AAC.1
MQPRRMAAGPVATRASRGAAAACARLASPRHGSGSRAALGIATRRPSRGAVSYTHLRAHETSAHL